MRKLTILLIFLFSFYKNEAQTWNLVWSDEFSGTTINTNNWSFETGAGGWGNSELEYYTNRPQNAVIQNDTLLIIGRKESYDGSNYTSARMKSEGLQYFTYGKIEASIKIPTGQGTWPAFWMLGEDISQVNWPSCGEIDIMEHINSNDTLYGTIHWNNGGAVQYGGNTKFNTSIFHTFGIIWDSSSISWTLDGTQYAQANIANNINNTGAFHSPFFILLNLAIGGNWPGNPNTSIIFPDTMFVDYVRVYQQGPPPATIAATISTDFCAGGSVALNANTGTGFTYQWSVNGKTISGATGASYTASTSGSYTVTVTAGALNTTSIATIVTVDIPPSASIAGNTQYITTTAANLSANTPTTGIGAWSVLSGTGTFANAASATSSVSGLSAGANVFQWTISNGTCPASSDTVTINVGYAPIAQTIVGQDSVTANQTGVVYSIPDSAGAVYHWTLPTGATITSANADSSQITVSFGISGGNISVEQTKANGKATSSLAVSINIATGVIAGATAATYEVQPNPFSDYTSVIVYSPSTEQITLSIIDVQGVTCYSSSQYYTNQEFTVGRELTSDGVYFVQLAYSNKIKVLKLVKMH